METTVTQKPDTSQAELDITVSADEFTPHIKQAAKKLSKDTPIKGFRPGKAPLNAVVETVGQERVLQEAIDAALPNFFVQAAVEHNIEAINRPAVAVHDISIDGSLRFTATVDVLPGVTLGDPSTIKATKKDIAVTDKDVEQELTLLAKSRATPKDVLRPAQQGDIVTVDFTITVDGNVIEGGTSKNHPITLGQGNFLEAFESNLLGTAAGEDKTFSFTFPDDYHRDSLQGKEASATVHVHTVQEREVPDITDEFAKSLGDFANAEDLKKKLKDNMAKEKEKREHNRYQRELAEGLVGISRFSAIPDILIEREIDSRLKEFAQMLQYQQKTLEQYLQEQNKTEANMRSDMKPAAETHVKVGLALRAFAQQQQIQATDDEVEKEVQEQLKAYGSPEEAEKNIDPKELKQHVHSIIVNRKTLKALEKAVVSA